MRNLIPKRIFSYLPYFLFLALPFLYYLGERLLGGSSCNAEPRGEWEFLLDHVVDGDTVVDRCGRHLRLVGVDTPEISEPFGGEAMEFTQAFLQAEKGKFLGKVCEPEPYDRYGRVLVRIYGRKGGDLAQALLEHGLAYPLPIPPCALPYEKGDLELFSRSMREGKGIFARVGAQELSPEEAPYACNTYRRVTGRVTSLKWQRKEGTILNMKGLKIRIPDEILPYHPGLKEALSRLPGKIVTVQGKIRCSRKGAKLTIWSPLLFAPGNEGNTPHR